MRCNYTVLDWFSPNIPALMLLFTRSVLIQDQIMVLIQGTGEGGRGLPYKKGGDALREISNEPLKGTNLGVA